MTTNRVNIGEVLLHGIVFDPKNAEVPIMMDAQQLMQVIRRLFAILDEREVDYLLVGGIAMLVYVEGRNTQDIDLIVDARALDKLPEIEIQDRNANFARGQFENLQVDLLFANNPLFARVQRDYAISQCFVERDIRCATAEGLFLLKLYALPALYRQGRFAHVGIYEHDLAMLIREHQLDVPSLLDLLSQYVSASDLRELREIVQEIEQHIERARRRFED